MKKILIVIILIIATNISYSQISNNQELQESVLNGWNTWNTRSLLSFVKMPEGLAMNLKMRQHVDRNTHFLENAWITNPIYEYPEQIVPNYHSYDGSYIDFHLSWVELEAQIQTATIGEDIVLLFTPFKQAERPHIVILQPSFLWNKEGYVKQENGRLIAVSPSGEVEFFATAPSTNVPLPVHTSYLSFNSDQQLGFSTGKQRSLAEIKEIIADKKQEHLAHIAKFGQLSEAYHAMQSVHSWNIIYDAFNDRAIVPVSRVWNERWGGYVLFDWDTYFSAAMMAVDQKELAYCNAIAITNAITDEGFIPNFEGPFNRKSFDRSQPPVGSIIVNLIYNKYQEKWFLEEVYDKLLSWNRWWEKNRDNEGYLSWGSSPYANKNNRTLKRDRMFDEQAAKYESGLDNSPLFDEAVFNDEKYMFDLASVGLMGLYIADCKELAKIAEELGKKDDVKELNNRAKKYSKKLEELWVEEKGIYVDKFLDKDEFSSHLAPTNFYPLIAKVPSQKQAERMINEHFYNPDEFYGKWMIPSIARNDPAYTDQTYWRGRIWAPMNFLVYLGLRNYDLPEARKELVEKSYQLLMNEWAENKRVYENYNADLGIGSDVKSSDGFYSWGGLLGFIVLMEEGYFDPKDQ